MRTLAALFALALPLGVHAQDGAAPSAPVIITPATTTQAEDPFAAVSTAVAVAVASSQGRFEAAMYDGELDRELCLVDPVCMSALADSASARFILWGELGERDDRRALSLELFDTRTGMPVARESVQVRTDAPIVDEVPQLVQALLARVEGLELARGRAAKVLVVPVSTPLERADEEEERLHRPGLIALTAVTGASAVIASLATAGMFGLALERDARAEEAVYQVDAAAFVEERNGYALGGMMVAATAIAFGVYTGVGATYWLLEER